MAAIIPVSPAPVERSFATDSIRNSIENVNSNPNEMFIQKFYIRKKPYQVVLNAGKLVWERDKTKKGQYNRSSLIR